MKSGFDQLEQELRRAEVRLTSGPPLASASRWPSRTIGTAVAAASALAAIAIAVGALVVLHGGKPAAGPPASSGATARFTDPEGWSIAYPANLHVTTAASHGFAQSDQVNVTSFSAPRVLRAKLRTGTRMEFGRLPFNAPLDSSGRFPADGIALILQSGRVTVLGSDSRFPIELKTFRAAPTGTFFTNAAVQRAGLPSPHARVIVADSELLTATILIGPKAPTTLRQTFAKVIGSLLFPTVPTGTHVGTGELVGPAADYPTGSITLVHAQFGDAHRAPVYLIHAPGRLTYGHACFVGGPCTPSGAFYGIGGQYNTRRNRAPLCAIRLDRRNLDFYCANLAVRWDRVGRVIRRPADESYIGSTEGLYAKITWNGQIMISPGFGPQISRRAVHQLWPTWNQPNELPFH
jgi:hypothetical protein